MQVKIIKYSLLFFLFIFFSFFLNAEDGKFSYLQGNDRKRCIEMLKKGEIEYDNNLKIYYKSTYSPLTGSLKKYLCNKSQQTSGAFSSLVNKLDNLDNFDTSNNKVDSNKSDAKNTDKQVSLSDESGLGAFGRGALNLLVPGAGLLNSPPGKNNLSNDVINENKKEENLSFLDATSTLLGFGTASSQSSVSMRAALLNLSSAQTFFLEALDEDELAIATRNYVEKLQSGSVIGEDDLEKTLVQSKENQKIINKKMMEVETLSLEAKQTFAKGIPSYSLGLFSLVQSGFSVSDTISNFSGGIGGVFSAIGLAVTAKDALTAIPLFFNSSGKIIDFAKKNDINTDELENAKNDLGI